MPNVTPVFDMLSADDTCALLLDHQPALMLFAGDIDPVQPGVEVANWLSWASKLLQDRADQEEGAELLAIYKEHLPQWHMPQVTQHAWKALTTRGAA